MGQQKPQVEFDPIPDKPGLSDKLNALAAQAATDIVGDNLTIAVDYNPQTGYFIRALGARPAEAISDGFWFQITSRTAQDSTDRCGYGGVEVRWTAAGVVEVVTGGRVASITGGDYGPAWEENDRRPVDIGTVTWAHIALVNGVKRIVFNKAIYLYPVFCTVDGGDSGYSNETFGGQTCTYTFTIIDQQGATLAAGLAPVNYMIADIEYNTPPAGSLGWAWFDSARQWQVFVPQLTPKGATTAAMDDLTYAIPYASADAQGSFRFDAGTWEFKVDTVPQPFREGLLGEDGNTTRTLRASMPYYDGGEGITVDYSDPLNPIITATGATESYDAAPPWLKLVDTTFWHQTVAEALASLGAVADPPVETVTPAQSRDSVLTLYPGVGVTFSQGPNNTDPISNLEVNFNSGHMMDTDPGCYINATASNYTGIDNIYVTNAFEIVFYAPRFDNYDNPPTDKNLLMFDANTGWWTAIDLTGGTNIYVYDDDHGLVVMFNAKRVGDVTPEVGDMLKWDGTKWIAFAPDTATAAEEITVVTNWRWNVAAHQFEKKTRKVKVFLIDGEAESGWTATPVGSDGGGVGAQPVQKTVVKDVFWDGTNLQQTKWTDHWVLASPTEGPSIVFTLELCPA